MLREMPERSGQRREAHAAVAVGDRKHRNEPAAADQPPEVVAWRHPSSRLDEKNTYYKNRTTDKGEAR
jgi:hypothetical protein